MRAARVADAAAARDASRTRRVRAAIDGSPPDARRAAAATSCSTSAVVARAAVRPPARAATASTRADARRTRSTASARACASSTASTAAHVARADVSRRARARRAYGRALATAVPARAAARRSCTRRSSTPSSGRSRTTAGWRRCRCWRGRSPALDRLRRPAVRARGSSPTRAERSASAAASTRTGACVAYAKVHAGDGAERERRALEARRRPATGLRVPRVLGASASDGALVLEPLAGRRARRADRRRARRPRSRGSARRSPTLHARPPPPAARFDAARRRAAGEARSP